MEANRILTRIRQPTEWGNNQFVMVFKGLRQKLSTTDKFNEKLMHGAILLHNWRISTCPRNQLHSFFKRLEEEAQELDQNEDDEETGADEEEEGEDEEA